MDIPPTNSPWLSTTLIWVCMYVCMYVCIMYERRILVYVLCLYVCVYIYVGKYLDKCMYGTASNSLDLKMVT